MIEVRVEGDNKKIFKDGRYDGEVTKIKESFAWKNVLANSVLNSFTHGVKKTEAEAFLQLGYKNVSTSG